MAADQVELQLAGTLGRDPHVRELPEPGRHPVDRGAARDRRLHGAARLPHGVEGARGDCYGSAVPGDRDHVLDRERSTVQSDGSWHARGRYALRGPDAKGDAKVPRRLADMSGEGRVRRLATRPSTSTRASRRLGVYLDPDTPAVGPGFLTINSGFPGSVCALQSKMTYRRPTAVTRSAA